MGGCLSKKGGPSEAKEETGAAGGEDVPPERPRSQPPEVHVDAPAEVHNEDLQAAGGEKISKGLDQYRKQCLDAHNEKRALHGVAPLKLNKKLCDFSQEWAKNLMDKGTFEHRKDRMFNGSMTGENISMKQGTNITFSGRDPVEQWYSEIKDYTYESNDMTRGTGHFTQVVWASSEELGAGWVEGPNGKHIAVCNYLPAGNLNGTFLKNVLKPS